MRDESPQSGIGSKPTTSESDKPNFFKKYSAHGVIAAILIGFTYFGIKIASLEQPPNANEKQGTEQQANTQSQTKPDDAYMTKKDQQELNEKLEQLKEHMSNGTLGLHKGVRVRDLQGNKFGSVTVGAGGKILHASENEISKRINPNDTLILLLVKNENYIRVKETKYSDEVDSTIQSNMPTGCTAILRLNNKEIIVDVAGVDTVKKQAMQKDQLECALVNAGMLVKSRISINATKMTGNFASKALESNGKFIDRRYWNTSNLKPVRQSHLDAAFNRKTARMTSAGRK
ncbi:MAG: hypothetical protein NTV88_01180 [Candidatus Micrarchaeota archaeon]|nr:hypothetical protein [Candidatus Micrarchaeota archaeon]